MKQLAHPTLPSTLDHQTASSTTWDAIVIGAGLAGSLAALGLARLGRKVLLIERSTFPRSKVCGACLNMDAVESLRVAGCWPAVESIGGHALENYQLHCKGKSLKLALPGGHAVSRDAMDWVLAKQACTEGAAFLCDTHVRIHAHHDSHIELVDPHKRTYRSKLVVDASGLSAKSGNESSGQDAFENQTVVAQDSRIGLGASWQVAPQHSASVIEPGTIYMAVASSGYVGLVITERATINLAAAVDRASVRQLGPASACREILETCDLKLDDGLESTHIAGTTTLTRRRKVAGDHRVLFAGDSSGYVEPFTGEGMAWALRAGLGVVEFADEAIDHWSPEIPLRWTHHLKQLIGPQKKRCRLISRTLRHPSLVRFSVGALSLFPPIGQFAVDSIQQARSLPVSNRRPWNRCPAS